MCVALLLTITQIVVNPYNNMYIVVMYFIWYTYNYNSISKFVVILTVISTYMYMCVQTSHISFFVSFLITYVILKNLKRGSEEKTNSKVNYTICRHVSRYILGTLPVYNNNNYIYIV